MTITNTNPIISDDIISNMPIIKNLVLKNKEPYGYLSSSQPF
jgi:hypothetical protein